MVLYKSEELCSPAQKEGFEPSRRYQRPTPFPGEPLQPLGYFCSVESLKYIIFQQASLTFVCSGEGGIRTHAPLRTNGFQDRLVMTTSISLQSVLSNVLLYSIEYFPFCQAVFQGFLIFLFPTEVKKLFPLWIGACGPFSRHTHLYSFYNLEGLTLRVLF